MRTLKFTLQYDGTDYVGWQRQPSGIVHPGAARGRAGADRAWADDDSWRRPDRCGRARAGQVASATVANLLEGPTLARALNAVLPLDVRVLTVEEMPEGFHARFDARSKTYEYRIVNAPLVLGVPAPLRLAHPAAARRRGDAHRRRSAHRPPRFRRLPGSRHAGRFDRADHSCPRGRGRRRIRPAAGHPRHRRRIPAPHGPEHRRHAGRGRRRTMGPVASPGRARLAGPLAGRPDGAAAGACF